ncbi:PIN domain-like protein [Mycena sp. CBHHK59/15]|nr:PIN domain-like protein [Mycena sp. CBHHK59/15]
MGVLGLTPFLQKSFPEVVKQLPDRLRGLAGKTVVIDGTLITQRLHFAQVPHHYRHILGWYKLVKELQDSGVSAICVFDGKERSLAKSREAERRREVQRLAVARGSIELDRVKRLHRFIDVLNHFQNLDLLQKERVSQLLQQISSEPDLPTTSADPNLSKLFQSVELVRESSSSREAQLLSNNDAEKDADFRYIDPPYKDIPPGIIKPSQEHDISRLPVDPAEDNINDSPPPAPASAPPHEEQLPKSTPISNDDSALPPESHTLQLSTSTFAPSISVAIPPPVPPSDLPNTFHESCDSHLSHIAPHTEDALDSQTQQPPNDADLPLLSFPSPPSPSSKLPPSSSSPPSKLALPSASTPIFSLPVVSSSNADRTLAPLDRSFPGPLTPDTPAPIEAVESVKSSLAPDEVHSTLVSLYLDFRQSIHKLASLTTLAPVSDVSGSSTDAEQQEARIEYSMTKSQIKLTADEAEVWKELASPLCASHPPDSQSPKETLETLSYRATLMSQSYERRTNPPTKQTYDESKEILRAMGIPCMETTGKYEAEALASSLVINGLADYVASEDTDVIIYEAPLMRNITNRNGPLVILSGAEIRDVLQLDRPSFVDFALLLGTDFSQRIKNVGPTRALKFIRQHKSIERVIEVEKKFTPRIPAPAYLAEVEVARLVFQTLPPVPDTKLLEQEKDDEGLAIILQRFGLGKILMNDEDWDFQEALEGNYFSDDPSAT